MMREICLFPRLQHQASPDQPAIGRKAPFPKGTGVRTHPSHTWATRRGKTPTWGPGWPEGGFSPFPLIFVPSRPVFYSKSFTNLVRTGAIPQTDTNTFGEPRLGARSLDAAGGLGLYLHYLRSSMREVGLQLIFALIPSTVNRYLTFARQILLATLRGYPASRITWMEDEELNEMTRLVQVRA